MKTIITSLSLLLGMTALGQGNSGDIIGRIVDEKGLPVENVKVYIQVGESYIKARTAEDGKFKLSAVPSGTFDLTAVSELNDTTRRDVSVPLDGIANVRDWKIGATEIVADIIYTKPLININPGNPMTIETEDIARSSAIRNPGLLVVAFNSDIKMNDDGDLIIRGSRAGDVIYMIDGVKIDNIASIPGAAVKGMTVYSGAIPAKYGDTTGGVVIMETKGYFDLYRAWKRDQD